MRRCMAISAAVFVGGIEPWKDALIEKAKALNVGPGAVSGTDVGPLISPEAKDRAARLIQSGVDQVCHCPLCVFATMIGSFGQGSNPASLCLCKEKIWTWLQCLIFRLWPSCPDLKHIGSQYVRRIDVVRLDAGS